MKYYAVTDTNVLVSAMLKWDSFIYSNAVIVKTDKTSLEFFIITIIKQKRMAKCHPQSN